MPLTLQCMTRQIMTLLRYLLQIGTLYDNVLQIK